MLLRSVEPGLVGAAPARGVAAAGAGRRTPEPGHGRREPRLGEPVLSSARGRARHPHTQGVAGGGHHRVPGDIQLEARDSIFLLYLGLNWTLVTGLGCSPVRIPILWPVSVLQRCSRPSVEPDTTNWLSGVKLASMWIPFKKIDKIFAG